MSDKLNEGMTEQVTEDIVNLDDEVAATDEEIAAAKAAKEAEKARLKAEKDAAKAEAAAKKAELKAEKDAAKEAAKAEREAEKAKLKAEKEAAKAAAKAEEAEGAVAEAKEAEEAESATEEASYTDAPEDANEALSEDADEQPTKKKGKKGLIITLISVGSVLVLGAIFACLWFFVFNRNDPFKDVAAMYEISQPSKIVANTNQTFGIVKNDAGEVTFEGHSLKGLYTLVIGEVDGNPAAKLTAVQDRLGSVEEGSGQAIKNPIFTDTSIREYIEGQGLRVTEKGNKGNWDPEGNSIIPEKGGISLNLSKKLAEGVTYENNKLSFTVKKDNTKAFLGAEEGLDSDLKVEITTDGVFVIGVKLDYVILGNETANTSESTVTIVVEYTYDFEELTID